MVELQGQHPITVQQSKPGLGVVEPVVKVGWFPLGDGRADATGDGNHQKQHDRHPQIGDPAHNSQQGFHRQLATRVRAPVVTSTTPLIGGTHWPSRLRLSKPGRLAAAVPASSSGTT